MLQHLPCPTLSPTPAHSPLPALHHHLLKANDIHVCMRASTSDPIKGPFISYCYVYVRVPGERGREGKGRGYRLYAAIHSQPPSRPHNNVCVCGWLCMFIYKALIHTPLPLQSPLPLPFPFLSFSFTPWYIELDPNELRKRPQTHQTDFLYLSFMHPQNFWNRSWVLG